MQRILTTTWTVGFRMPSLHVYSFQLHTFLTKESCVVNPVISILQLDYKAPLSEKLERNRHTKQSEALKAYKLHEQQNILLCFSSCACAEAKIGQAKAAHGKRDIYILKDDPPRRTG